MDLTTIFIITIIISFIMRTEAKLEIYKDIADLGYKFNHKKYQELLDIEDQDIDIITKTIENFYMYIPFYNIIVDLFRKIDYYNQKDILLERLIKYGALEKMTKEEQNKYSKRKTGHNAIKIEKERLKKLSYSSLAEFSNGSKIWFDFKDEIDEKDSLIDIIEIVEVSGPYKQLNTEELKQKVYYSLMILGNHIIEEEQNKKEVIEEENGVVEEIFETPFQNETKKNNKPKIRIRKK